MNYINDDYLLGHLLKSARKTGIEKLEIDILSNTAHPQELLTRITSDSISYYSKWFLTLVENSGSSMSMINSAIMTIEFDL